MPSSPGSFRQVAGSSAGLIRVLVWTMSLLAVFSVRAANADAPPRVLVSIKPVHSLVAAIMKGVAEPGLIVTDGSPAEFELTELVGRQLAEADLIIWMGPELERGLAAVLEDPAMKERTLELLDSDRIKVLPARHAAGRDPYAWLDTRNMLILLDEFTQMLAERDPARAHRYEQNRLEMAARLAQLDRQLEYGYKEVSAKPVFLYHDTQQYFEQAYALKAAGIAAAPGQPPDAADLLRLRAQMAEADEPCFFTEAGLAEPHLDLVLGGTNARPVALDSLATRLEPGPDLYLQQMRNHYRTIRSCIERTTAPERTVNEPPDGAVPPVEDLGIHGKYLLMNHFGESVTNLDFAGSYQLIYFGYTFCPDICPTSLTVMTQALDLLGDKANRIQPLFITVDPERDTLGVLRRYTAYFHPRLLGLTGSREMIDRTAANFHVRYEKVVSKDRPADRYAVDHTSSLFLLGPHSEFVAKFANGLPPGELAERLDALVSD